MSIPITEPPAWESNENISDSNNDKPNNKNNAMNNNIIHADNPNSIGGYMFNAGNADENTRG